MGGHKEKKHKKEKKSKKKRRQQSTSSSEDEWVEKQPTSTSEQTSRGEDKPREEWMNLFSNFTTVSNLDRRQEREEQKRLKLAKDQYNPRKNVRELNPYWKDGGSGLPSFKKPTDQNFEYDSSYKSSSSNWRKRSDSSTIVINNSEKSDPIKAHATDGCEEREVVKTIYTDKELNSLAAKLVKAEIMGNEMQIKELKEKLERARNTKEALVKSESEEVLLSLTDNQGFSVPLKLKSEFGEDIGSKRKKQKVETHDKGKRMRYFADDDKHSLQQMFENEKYQNVDDQNKEFIRMTSKIKNDDMDHVFEDKIRRKSDESSDRKNEEKAIQKHRAMVKNLNNCSFCIQSDVMFKHLIICLGETMFLMLPPFEPITVGHCFIVPIRHVPCATQLDENEWSELLNIRKSLTKMYLSNNDNVIFFETAISLYKFPHMVFECVPIPKEQGDLAPIYFKKAIDESETEWSSNVKLVSLAGRDVRRAIPKGLPYFAVSFGMTEGYAHVIEDEKVFPTNFAQEVVGGMLNLHHSKWRKPKRQSFNEQSARVTEFSKIWFSYDCTKV